MNIQIKPMETDDEIRGKAYVHWKSWQEAYVGLIDPGYLASLTLEKCEKTAFRWRDSLLVAKEGDRVVGFAGFGPYRDSALEGAGEVVALYILKEYYGTGLGRALMEAALEQLAGHSPIYLWVLEGNARAIRFYEKCGFRFDGTRSELPLGTPAVELRMIRK